MDIKKGKIGNALESVAPDHVVAEAKDIYDNTLGKYQTELNQLIGQGGGGEPSAYIKDAVKSSDGNTLTLTKKDSSTVVFTPNGGGSDSVKYTSQSLTNSQKAQARTNIGAGTSTFSGTYSDLTGKPTIPTSLSQLSGDSTHRTVTDSEKTSWNGKADQSDVNTRLDAQDAQIASLTGSQVTVVTDHTSVTSPSSQIIYREPDSAHNPPQGYTDYMYQGGAWKVIAVHTFPGIDQKPIYKSQNPISSNGAYGVLERSMKNTEYISENTLLTASDNVGFYYSNGPHNGVSSFRYRKYPVVAGNMYTFSSHFGGNTDIPFIYWLNSSSTIIGNEPFQGNPGSGSDPVTFVDQPVVAPPGAAYLVLNRYNDDNYACNVKLVGQVILSRELKKGLSDTTWNTDAISKNICISQLDELLAEQTVTGSFINDDGSVGSNQNFGYQKYYVTEGDTYTFSGVLNGANIHYVHWYDSNDKHLGFSKYAGVSNKRVVYVDQPVIAPPEADYALLNIQPYTANNVYNFKHVVAMSENVDEIRKSIARLSDLTLQYPVYPTEGEGKFYYNDGPRSNSGFTYFRYEVEPKKVYTFSSGFNSDSSIWFVYWLDENGNIIGREPYKGNEGSGSAPVTYVDQPVIAPENAAYMILNTYNNNTKEKAVKKTGDTPRYMAMKGYLPSCNLKDVKEPGTWLLIDSNTYQGVPGGNSIGFLRVSVLGDWFLQEFYSFGGSQLYKRKFDNGGMVEDWTLISGGGGSGSVTNEYTFNEYSQTVNLTASPTITADTNNYLASTGDTTDRTASILALLQAAGTCHLGPGTFWVDGLIMPNDSSLIGSGTATKVYLKSGTNKYAVKMADRCMVKDMQILGGTSDITVSTAGTRVGILWQGNYTQQQSSGSQPKYGTVDNVYLSRFDNGGIRCYDTGYGTSNYLAVTNCHIWNCHVGVNIDYWSEFHKFTNVRCAYCYYGCVNNGGNNMFVNCDFSSCSGVAFLMDNSQGQSTNNSHGSCVACVFNHTADNSGTGIKVLNCDNGFVFDGCQIFFSKIHIEDSDGVSFTACNFGYSNCDIYISGGGTALFANNLHQEKPTITITNNSKTHFVNCYVRSTGEVVTA